MSKLEMQQCVLGQVFTNCYFLKNKETGELLIVDPGDYAEKVFQKVTLMQGKPVGEHLPHWSRISFGDFLARSRNIFPVRSWKNLRLRQEDRTV